MFFDWNETVVGRVAEMLRQGQSSGAIAKAIGATRNSVCGKVRKTKILAEIGLGSKRDKAEHIAQLAVRQRKIERAAKAIKPKVEKPNPITLIAEDLFNIDALRLTLLELGPRQCKFAINDAAIGEEHLFCGKPTEDLRPWCSRHHKLAFRVSS